ncbi:MAG: helix-turn-helix transcriptional regulator [Sphaerochaetaceae bacterium]
MDKLSQGELDLTSLFFIHRGGLSNKELAYMLKTSENAVKNRFKVVFNKTNTASRTELYSHIASYC